MFLIILLVCFTMVMFIWLLGNLGSVAMGDAGKWLAFFACLILGVVVFLLGSGVIVVESLRR
jgi:hypothetical protein